MILLLASLFWLGLKIWFVWLLLFGWWVPAALSRFCDYLDRPRPLVQDAYWKHQSRLQYEAWARMDRENAAKKGVRP